VNSQYVIILVQKFAFKTCLIKNVASMMCHCILLLQSGFIKGCLGSLNQVIVYDDDVTLLGDYMNNVTNNEKIHENT
jgi:hypothetical protein